MRTAEGVLQMERKTIRISGKRQLTIPQKFFERLGFTDEAECILRGDELILKPAPVQSGGEFAEQILADLIQQGLTGERLLQEFKNAQGWIIISKHYIRCITTISGK